MRNGNALPIPGILLGAYPERRVAPEDTLARLGRRARAGFETIGGLYSRHYRRFIERVRIVDAELAGSGFIHLERRLLDVRARLSHEGFTEPLLAEAFGLVIQACAHALGMRVYDTQLMAARIMLDSRLAEMATGEGKTLAAAVCAATAALAGIPVHVITANDYLAARDAESLQPLYGALGLSLGCITQPLDAAGRQHAYACDITYCTAKELVFDYLRDWIALGRNRRDLHLRATRLDATAAGTSTVLLRGLCMAIVDEADSILIDEARIPLILSELCANPAELEYHRQALTLASHMTVGHDFVLDRQSVSAELTGPGQALLEQRAAELGVVWGNRLHRAEAVATALAALNLYHRDRHYLIRDGSVAIIDETTGRLAPGRMWSHGLHQMIELKEGCAPSSELITAAQITYQRFFRRYLRLGGMSGTLWEARAELQSAYGFDIVRVPLRRPCRRRVLPTRIFPDRESHWTAVVRRIAEIHRSGRPVLVGTDSVAESETLSKLLDQAELPHAVLNARHDAQEAQIVARAGEPGRITVATNMAGRGTDIPLAPGIATQGGLHLLCCQHNVSRRIDRQLLGRCARQGEPGSAETFISLDKPLIARVVPAWARRYVCQDGRVRPAWLIALILRLPQILEERHQCNQRRNLSQQDARWDSHSSIGGPSE